MTTAQRRTEMSGLLALVPHRSCSWKVDVRHSTSFWRLLFNEAEQVRRLFRRFVQVGSLMKVVQEARARGWRNKDWTTTSGRQQIGKMHDRSSLQEFFHCGTYLDELKRRHQYFEGTHAPIDPAPASRTLG